MVKKYYFYGGVTFANRVWQALKIKSKGISAVLKGVLVKALTRKSNPWHPKLVGVRAGSAQWGWDDATPEPRTLANHLLEFGIDLSEKVMERFRNVPDNVDWVMDEIREPDDKPIVTDLEKMPIAKLVYSLEDVKKLTPLSKGAPNSAGVYVGIIEWQGEIRPAVIKELYSCDTKEFEYAQAYDRLGVGPRFYGLVQTAAGTTVGYAMQLGIGETFLTLPGSYRYYRYTQQYAVHSTKLDQDQKTILRRIRDAGLYTPENYLLTRKNRLIGIDVGGRRVSDSKRYTEFIRSHQTVDDEDLQEAAKREKIEGAADGQRDTPLSIEQFYTEKVKNGKTRLQLWNEEADVGAAIVPSVYDKDYREVLVKMLKSLTNNSRNAHYLSIGTGVGVVEHDLSKEGFNNITCVEVMEEAVQILRKKGLKALKASGLALPITDESQDVVYMDGSLGHMASSFKPPFIAPFAKPLSEAYRVLGIEGRIIISDDPPRDNAKYQINPRVYLLRVNIEVVKEELSNAGFDIEKITHIPYQRPNIGEVYRRVIIAKKRANFKASKPANEVDRKDKQSPKIKLPSAVSGIDLRSIAPKSNKE